MISPHTLLVCIGLLVSGTSADTPITGYNPGGPLVPAPTPSASFLGTLPGHKVSLAASSYPATCTTVLPKEPPLEIDCTFKQKTRYATQSVNCSGCALEILQLGVGLPCEKVATVEGYTTITSTVCASSASAMPST